LHILYVQHSWLSNFGKKKDHARPFFLHDLFYE